MTDGLTLSSGEPKEKPSALTCPFGVATVTAPDAPWPTMAVMLVGELTVNDPAAAAPKRTAVAPVKLVPVMVTDVPVPPPDGLMAVISGKLRVP